MAGAQPADEGSVTLRGEAEDLCRGSCLKLATLAFAALFAIAPLALADPGAAPVSEIVDRFVSATQAQQENLRDLSMEVEIEAALPKLKKQGRM